MRWFRRWVLPFVQLALLVAGVLAMVWILWAVAYFLEP